MATPVMPGGKPIPGPITAGDELAKKAAEDAANAASDAAEAQAKANERRLAAFNTTQLQEDIAMILALKDTDPDLQRAWDFYLAGNVDGFRAAILGSNFYTTKNKY